MPLLVWFGQAVVALAGYLTAMVSKRVAIGIALVAGFTALLLTFQAAIDLAINSIDYETNSIVAYGLGLLPSNLSTCIAAIVTAQIAAMVYKFQSKVLWARTYGI